MCVCAREKVCVCERERESVCVCERERKCVCVCERERENQNTLDTYYICTVGVLIFFYVNIQCTQNFVYVLR